MFFKYRLNQLPTVGVTVKVNAESVEIVLVLSPFVGSIARAATAFATVIWAPYSVVLPLRVTAYKVLFVRVSVPDSVTLPVPPPPAPE